MPEERKLEERKVTVSARWDKDLVPAGESSQRNLLLEITAPPKPEQMASEGDLDALVGKPNSLSVPAPASTENGEVPE